MKINLDSPPEEVRIEIVPLIDVIFCILTFFIVATLQLTRQQAISVDLPKAQTGVTQTRQMLIVTLDDFGQVYVEQQLMASIQQLSEALKNYRATSPNGLMVLYASRTASYNDVVQVLDLLRAVGGDRVALATIPGAGQQTPSSNTGVPGVPSVPGITPYSGSNPYNPYGSQNPAIPYNPNTPQVPANSGQLPSGQGITPSSPGNVPLTPVPTPGATTAPGNGNTAPQR